MGKKWVIIPVEVKQREFLGRMLLACVAANSGYSVLLGHDRVIRRLAAYLPKGIIFDKSLGMARDRKVLRYHRLGYKLTALDEESTGFYVEPDLILPLRLSHEALERAEYWFCLSETIREHAARLFPNHADKFVTTGMPRTDVWRPEVNGIFGDETARIRAEHGKYILFCSNFAHVIHARSGAFLDQQYRRLAKSNSEISDFRLSTEQEGRDNLDKFVAVFPKIRTWFPHVKLIVRPHPSEDHEYWHSLAAKTGHFEVQTNGAASPWILGAECLLHHGCTTGVEAEIMGKPHIMYAPCPDKHHDTEMMKTFAPIVHTQDKLRAKLSSIMDGDYNQKDRNDLESYFASLTGELSSRKIVSSFHSIDVAPQKLRRWLKLMRFTPRHLIAQYWPRSRKAGSYSRQKWSETSAGDVAQIAARFQSLLGLENTLTTEEVFPQLFRIEKLETQE